MPGPFRASTHDVRLALATAALLATLLLSASAASASPIKRDEEILFFPTAARLSADRSHWIVPLHAWVFEAETESLWRRGTLEGLGRSFGLDAGAAESAIFRQRARWFLVDNERGKRFGVTLAADGQDIGPSGADGHLRAEIALPRRAASEERTSFWLRYGAVLAPGDRRRFEGETLFASSEGLSVISDIDDTIKISRVTDRRALLAHTFLKPFEAAPGMAEAYARLAAAGADFHYVSSSPWQLFPALRDFMAAAAFPRGSFHLRQFRLKDESLLNLFKSSRETKPPVIDALFAAYPRRRFLLIGDSGEQDPEIYGDIARRHPGRVQHIYIRRVTSESRQAARFRSAFASLPADLWTLFHDAAVIRP